MSDTTMSKTWLEHKNVRLWNDNARLTKQLAIAVEAIDRMKDNSGRRESNFKIGVEALAKIKKCEVE